MAKWSDMLTLLAVDAPADQTNENGFNAEPTEQRRDVFANKKSVGYSEFYKSAQAGYTAELKFDVHTGDYHGEGLAEYGGKRYKILRTYETKNGEFTELTLSDLSERATADAGASEDPAAGDDPEGGGEDGEV